MNTNSTKSIIKRYKEMYNEMYAVQARPGSNFLDDWLASEDYKKDPTPTQYTERKYEFFLRHYKYQITNNLTKNF